MAHVGVERLVVTAGIVMVDTGDVMLVKARREMLLVGLLPLLVESAGALVEVVAHLCHRPALQTSYS